MIVERIGYLKLQDVLDMIKNGKVFSIYETHKKTNILIENTSWDTKFSMYYAVKDRLPYKVLEGKKVVDCINCIFNSKIDNISELNVKNWNNSEQIMSYNPIDRF